ncbi:hypothetical protein Y1Q_0017855 [Alligator mississippiensis]|uniref:Uncharacterized protein n=1 Tax=Alligator mississippiensis TaxID=8496 RepID=A0A151P1R3_ALLMI|nr:hypothetical protein Y1Q_0017855 [Alligator mississippiensis]
MRSGTWRKSSGCSRGLWPSAAPPHLASREGPAGPWSRYPSVPPSSASGSGPWGSAFCWRLFIYIYQRF